MAMSPERAALWDTLCAAADDFRILAPWRWMNDTQVIGVREPGGDAIGWCIVIGGLGEHFGLVLYDGDAGWTSFRNLQEGWPTPEDASMLQCGRSITFVRHGDLMRPMRALWKSLTRRWSGSAWIEATDFNPGYLPDLLSEEDIPWMVRALRSVMAMAATLKDQPHVAQPDHAGRLLVDNAGDGEPVWIRSHPPPYVLSKASAFPIDALAVAHYARRAQRGAGDWLVDWARPFAVVMENRGTRPYFPEILIIIDAQSGHILSFSPLEDLAQHCAAEFVRRAQDRLPARLVVRRTEMRVQLSALGMALGIPVVWIPESMHAIDQVIARMQQAYDRAPPTR